MLTIVANAVDFFLSKYSYAAELKAFFMAYQGAIAIRSTRNKDKSLNWFHAFGLSFVRGMGGSAFGNIMFARPTVLISSDLGLLACILAFVIVNWLPADLGYRLGKSLPGATVTIVFAQMFRLAGTVSFVTAAHEFLQDKPPSPYYPTPILGPIFHATMLGNIGAFVLNGIDGYLRNGVPPAFQTSLFCATFFHFFAHDKAGQVGVILRSFFQPIQEYLDIVDDRTFAIFFVGTFLEVTGMLQAPFVLGPSWSPFTSILTPFVGGGSRSVSSSTTPSVNTESSSNTSDIAEKSTAVVSGEDGKSRRKNKKKKKSKES